MEELLLNLRTYFIYFIHNVALSLCPHSQLAADPQALLQINTKHLWFYAFLSALLADPLYASLSLLIAHILSLLARFGPSVIATLIKNGSGGSPVF